MTRHFLKRALPVLALLLPLLAPLTARPQVVPLPALKATQLSVSGLSSGAFMAVQFDVAFPPA